MVSASKIATGSSLAAVPAVVAAGAVYKDELFGTSLSKEEPSKVSTTTEKEEDIYWKFFYFLLKNYLKKHSSESSLDSSLTNWQQLKQKCSSWSNENSKNFVDVTSENCAVVLAFNNTGNTDWGKYLGYFDKFKSDSWNTKEINYSDSNSNDNNNYWKLFSTWESSSPSLAVTDTALIKNSSWRPSQANTQ